MHCLRSVLLSVFAYFLFGYNVDVATSSTTSSCYNTRFANVTWDNHNWEVRNTNIDQGHFQSRQSIANGYFGINVAEIVPGFEVDVAVDGDNINGWPLFAQRQTFATIAGFFDEQPRTNGSNFPWLYQYGGESVISGVPHWSGIIVDLGDGIYLDATVNITTISNFVSTLNAKSGVSTWSYTWSPTPKISFKILYTMFAHKLHVNQAFVQLQITPSADVRVSIANIIDGRSAVRTDFVGSGMDGLAIFSAVSPINVDAKAYIYAAMHATPELDAATLSLVKDKPYIGVNESSIAQAAYANLKAGTTTVIAKYVGAASSDAFKDPQRQAREACAQAMEAGFEASLKTHVQEWATVLPPSSVDDYTDPQSGRLPADEYIIEAAITAVLNPYYLLQNTVSANARSKVDNAPVDTWSISVGGLGSDSYAGLVFWDAETWMHPGLAASHPESSLQIAKYRVEKYGQALKNAQTSYQSSKSTTKFSSDAAVYPWTSGRYGNCTGTGPCFDYEYHINGDIAQAFANYWVTSGDTKYFEQALFPIYNSIALFYSEAVKPNGTSFVLTNLTDPDEFADHVDNGGFTMALISDTLANANIFREMFGKERSKTFENIAQNVEIAKNADARIILEYTGMNGSIDVKQADVVLVTYPLNFKLDYTKQDSLNDLEYYAGKQSLDGPGMTYSTFSIVASSVDVAGCSAYTYQQWSEQPYVREPWFQFSEQLVDNYQSNGGFHPAFPFLTGHGGANQVTLFGYLGLRLTPDQILHIDPSIAPQIPHLKYRIFYWHGWPISAVATQAHTTITRPKGEAALSTANLTYTTMPIQVQIGNNTKDTYKLAPGGSLTFKNRNVGQIKAVDGNIAQCLPVFSPDPFQPGQFPIAAVDGARSTKWEPKFSNRTQSITLNLESQPFQPITGLYFDWASDPPTKFTVLFHNDTSTAHAAVVASQNVAINMPYNAAHAALVTPYSSNTTNVTFEKPVWSGKYATLEILGNQGSNLTNATGATVAEWVIIGGTI